MSLHDTIKEDAKKVFANDQDFAEPIVYYKRNGRSRKIDAVVVRSNAVMLPESQGDLNTPVFEVYVANNETDGIASDEIDLGGDELALSPRVGEPTERRSILRILEHDEGMMVLECR
jgi:hypothetical protein